MHLQNTGFLPMFCRCLLLSGGFYRNIEDLRISVLSDFDFIGIAFVDNHVCSGVGLENAQNCFLTMLEMPDSVHRMFGI